MTRVLSCHAPYRCRQSGACCTANWPIPVEVNRLTRLQAALANGTLSPATGTRHDAIDTPLEAPSDTPARLGLADGRCVFHGAPGPRDCAIHHALGHDALPLTCRQFPRVSVRDPRGVSITLSHYCPTASALLASTTGPIAIVHDASAFPPGAEYVGLDVRDALPPALRPDMLMDWDGWWLVETLSVDLLANHEEAPDRTLARLRIAVDHLRPWSPADGPLTDAVRRAFAAAENAARPAVLTDDDVARLAFEVDDSIPADLVAGIPPARAASRPSDAVVTRFLAAHAFASWMAHLGEDLGAWLRSIEAAYALLVTGSDLAGADLRLRHLADTRQLARTWGRARPSRARVTRRP